jgi:ferredoxin-NADP reductase
MTAVLVPYTVASIDEPAEQVRTLRLTPTRRAEVAPYAPGSHIEVQCGERRNAYSLIGDPP